MLDEQAKRKDNFDERNSASVVLADGQTWHLPKPWLEIRPMFRRGRAVSSYPVLTYGAELDALVEAISECEDRTGQLVGLCTLAAYLLQWHYELADGDLDGLLAFRAADPASAKWTETVIEVATGQSGPKVSRAGGG